MPIKFTNKTCEQFIDELALSSPVPGGGGASALVGAIGVALGMMVGNLTVGKHSYAGVEADVLKLLEKSEGIKSQLVKLVDKEAVTFAPLSNAYKMPKDDPSRGQVMEDALRLACTVPMEIMRLCASAIEICDMLAKMGSILALSDAGVSAVFCKAALQGASLNIFINTKYMDNRGYAKKIDTEAIGILRKYCAMADTIFESVITKLR